MVIYCVAYGCNTLHDVRKTVSFHRFPFNRPEILKLWVIAIRRENWYPSKSSRICGNHFLKDDYLIKPGLTTKLLKHDAVPSVFAFPDHLKRKTVSARRTITKHVVETPIKDESIDMNEANQQHSTSTSSHSSYVCQGTQTPPDKLFSLKRKVKTLQQKIKRRDLKIFSMKDVVNSIKNSGHSNDNLNGVLDNYFEGLPLELVLLKKKENELKHPGQRRYSPLMKQFAHTLYFYSPKAYNFLKEYFILPNGRTIRKWLQSVNCEPGILTEVLSFLKNELKNKEDLKNCALIIDAMAIRKQVNWDNVEGKFTGNVNYGGIVDVDFEDIASEALFFQIVSYTANFKCPIAYFLINKADSNLQTQLINSCVRSLFECGIIVRSVTSDGTQTNVATFNKLGCDFTYNKYIPYFCHPCLPNVNIYCMLDSCHMLKLARNALAETNLCSNKGNITWEYIKNLDKVQQSEQLCLANSLTSNHVYYKNKIMNVRLAGQALSSGVADAIEYLEKCGINNFQGSGATVEFIKTIDRIFDILNCRNPYGKGYKAPVRQNSVKYFEEIFLNAENYFKSLTINGVPLLMHNRKTFAFGFIITMKSTIGLVNDLFQLPYKAPAYFLSYKCSQDHLELYFSCIRSQGGWNNNPNSQQLKWSLRKLLFKNSVKPSINANCSDFGNYCTPAFEFRSEKRQTTIMHNEIDCDEISDFIAHLGDRNLTDLQENILYYICGYVVRTLTSQLTCVHCVEILWNKSDDSDHSYSASPKSYKKFTNFATRGGLIYCSDVVYEIIKFTERHFRYILEQKNILKKKNLKQLLANAVIRHFSQKLSIFKPIHPTVQEFISEDCHELQLIRRIIEIFLKCRMHHHAKVLNLQLNGPKASIRQKMTKLILFNHC